MARGFRAGGGGINGITPSGEYVEVTADGVKTYATLFASAFVLVNSTKITNKSVLEIIQTNGEIMVFSLNLRNQSKLSYSRYVINQANNRMEVGRIYIEATPLNCYWNICTNTTSGNSFSNQNASVPPANTVIRINY